MQSLLTEVASMGWRMRDFKADDQYIESPLEEPLPPRCDNCVPSAAERKQPQQYEVLYNEERRQEEMEKKKGQQAMNKLGSALL